MNPTDVIATLLRYGKGPIVRGLAWILVAWLGSKGITAEQAGNTAEALWPSIAAIITAIGSLVWSAYSARTLHYTTPPSPSDTTTLKPPAGG